MNKTFYRLGSGSMLLALLSSRPPQSQAQSLAYEPYRQTVPKRSAKAPKVSVKQALNSLREHYKVDILFSDPAVKDLVVPESLIQLNQPLEQTLEAVLNSVGLRYRKSNDGAYLITPGVKKDKPAPPQSASSAADLKPNATPVALTVTGKVTDEKGEGLLGVTVLLKGTTNGTATGVDGSYSLTVPDGNGTLLVSFIGYQPQEVPLNNRSTINVSLLPDTKALEEVVVVGYGTQKKADVTGAVASVGATTIARAATPDATGALQGQVPGVVVVKNVGKPGGGYSINIRGTSSIGGSNSPLYVIDGIPTTSGINDLNPADIEKIDVLKDASATAIYGSRGAKGVVIVTTKRRKSGKTTISYDAYAGIRTPTHLPDMFNGAEYVAYRTELFTAQGRDVSRNNTAFFTPAQWENIDAGRFTNWPDLLLENGLQMNHNVTASGGDEKTRFAISAGLLQEEGNVKPENFKRYSLRGNVDRQISDKWKAGLNLYLSQSLQDLGSSEALRSAYRLPPMTYPYDEAGNRVFAVYGTNTVTNPFFDTENEIRQNRNLRTFGNLYVQVEPVPGLVLKSTISPNYTASRSGQYFGPLSKQSLGGAVPSQGLNTNSEQFTWVLDNQAIYDAQFGSHKLTATVVQSLQKDRLESNNITVEGLPYKSLWYNLGTAGTVRAYGSGFTQSTLSSLMGRVNYNFKDKFLLTATGRWDGSSRLAAGNQWGFFPSASVAYRVSQEAFMQDAAAVSDLKVRLSYGLTGNDRVDPYSTQATLGQTYYDFGGVLAPGYAPSQLPNKNLTWETTQEVNLGIDYGFFKNRVTGSVDIYNRLIDNILLNRQLPAQAGFNSIVDNIGKLRNRGIEVGLGTVNIETEKFLWKSDFVFDANRNAILELNGGKKDDVGNRLFIGEPVQVNYDYVFDGIWQVEERDEATKYNQKPGQVRVKDLDGNGAINASDRQIIGKRVPNWTGSVGNTFRYGNLDLYVLVYTRQGEQYTSNFDATFENYNSDYNQVKLGYWTAANPSQKYFQPGNPGPYASIPTYRDVSFSRVGNITLGYNLPAGLVKAIKVNSLRVYATALNPFTFTKYEGFDPEWPSANTYGTAVSTSSYLLGINLSL